jgi:hypothetical protein
VAFTGVSHLLPNAPNPFPEETALRFALSKSGPAELAIFDSGGRLVRRLDARTLPAGIHELVWDGRDENARAVGSGVYFARFRSGDHSDSRPIVVMR